MVANGSWSFPEDDSRAATLGWTNMSGADLCNAGPDLPSCLTVNLGATTIMPRLALAKELVKTRQISILGKSFSLLNSIHGPRTQIVTQIICAPFL